MDGQQGGDVQELEEDGYLLHQEVLLGQDFGPLEVRKLLLGRDDVT